MTKSTTSLLTLIFLFFVLIGCTSPPTEENNVVPLQEATSTIRSRPLQTITAESPTQEPQVITPIPTKISELEADPTKEPAKHIDSSHFITESFKIAPETYTLVNHTPLLQPQSTPRVIFDGRIGGQNNVLAYYDNIVYIGTENELNIYDISDKNHPILINRLMFHERPAAMARYKDRALLSTIGFETGSFIQLDLKDPTTPQIIEESYGLSFHLYQKDSLVLAESGFVVRWMAIIDLDKNNAHQEPPLKTLIRTHMQESSDTYDNEPHAPRSFMLHGDILALTWSNQNCLHTQDEPPCRSGVLVINIQDIQAPYIIASYFDPDRPTRVQNLTSAGMLTIIPAQPGNSPIDLTELVSIDHFEADSPEQTEPGFNTDSLHPAWGDAAVNHIATYENFAYISTSQNALYVLNIENLPQISVTQRIQLNTTPSKLEIIENHLYVYDESNMHIYSLENPNRPLKTQETQLDSGKEIFTALSPSIRIRVQGTQLTVENNTSTLSDTSSVLSTLDLASITAGNPVIYNQHAYIPTDLNVVIIDLSDPTNPQIVGSIDETVPDSYTQFFDLAQYENKLYAHCHVNAICVFDLSIDPTTPVFLETIPNLFCGVLFGLESNATSTWAKLDFNENTNTSYLAHASSGFMYEMVPTNLCFDVYGSWVMPEVVAKENYLLVAHKNFGLIVFHHE